MSWVPSEGAVRTTHSHLDRLGLMSLGWRTHVGAGWPTILISQELRGFQAQWTVCLGKSWIKWDELVTVGGRHHLLQLSRNVVQESGSPSPACPFCFTPTLFVILFIPTFTTLLLLGSIAHEV